MTDHVAPRSTAPCPDPATAVTVDELVAALGRLKMWAGNPSYREIAKRISRNRGSRSGVAHSTVADVFRAGRRRLDLDLLLAVVRALGVAEPGVDRWRTAFVAVRAPSRSGAGPLVLHQLPRDLATFVGRAAELARIFRVAEAPGAGSPVVLSIEGMPGVGKTQLAIHAAHRLLRAGRYADLQLYANLHGFDAYQTPADPAAVLDGFLRQLGVPGGHIPADRQERAAMFRDRLAGRAGVIILDDAADGPQIHDLVPATAGVLVLVTTRRRMVGVDGILPVPLDVFDPHDALVLLRGIAGADRIDADPSAAEAVVAACGGLPIALTLAAQRLRTRPTWQLCDLVYHLANQRTEGPNRNRPTVRALFDLSYRGLAAPHRLLLRRLALHPGHDFSTTSTAALAGLSSQQAGRLLEDLLDEHLVVQRRAGRYELHSLIHEYCRQLCLTDPDQQAARRRLLDHYQVTAGKAMDMVAPYAAPHRPPTAARPAPTAPLDTPQVARAWLDAERSSLCVAAQTACDLGRPSIVVDLSATLAVYLDNGAYRADALDLHGRAVQAATDLNDRTGLTRALINMALTEVGLGQYASARLHLDRSLELARQDGDHASIGRALNATATVCIRTGDLQTARASLMAGLEASTAGEDRLTRTQCLGNLGIVHAQHGRYGPAIDFLRRALTLTQQMGNTTLQSQLLLNLGNAHAVQDDYTAALPYLRRGLALAERNGSTHVQAYLLSTLGYTAVQLGHLDEAAAYLDRAQAFSYALGDRASQAQILGARADLCHRQGAHQRALARYRIALRLATEICAGPIQIDTFNGIGTVLQAMGRAGDAADFHRQALRLATGLGDPRKQAQSRRLLTDASTTAGDIGPAIVYELVRDSGSGGQTA